MTSHRTLMVGTALAVSMLLSLAGCAVPLFGQSPTPAAPAAPAHAAAAAAAGPGVPASAWSAPLPHAGQPTDLLRWWSQFDDPVLLSIVDAAQRASPSLASATTRIAQARAARVAAGAALLPLVDAGASAGRGRAEPRAALATTTTAGLQASWEIDLFGAGRAARDAGQARLEGAQAAWHAARVSVAAEAASSYLALRACEAQLGQSQVDAASRAETARVNDKGAAAGLLAPATAALSRASAAQGRAQVTAQRAQCDALVKALVALTAADEAALRLQLEPGRARLPQPAPIAFDTVPAALLAQRPDLAEAALAVEAAAADQRIADARRWPRVSLAGSVGAMGISTGAGSVNGSTWTIGPLQVTFPIFDGGTRSANLDAARAAYDESVVQYQARLRTAVREVEEAMVALQSTAARQEDARVATEGFDSSFRATEARFKGGLASVFELEDARRTAVAANSALIDLQRERVAAWIALYRALGGGWSETQAAATPAPRAP